MKEFHPTTVWIAEGTWVTIWYAIVIVSHRDIVMSDSHPVEPSFSGHQLNLQNKMCYFTCPQIMDTLKFVCVIRSLSYQHFDNRCHVHITCIWADFGTIPKHHLTLPFCFACWHQGVGCPDCLDRGVGLSVRATWPPNGEAQFKPRVVRTSLLFQCVLVLFFITSIKQLQPVCWCLGSKLAKLASVIVSLLICAW